MHINFNKEMRENEEERLPDLVIDHLSLDLPEGTRYETDDDGDLILISTTGKLKISDLELLDYDEFKEKIGENPSKADILLYSYNSQKPLQFKSVREGYLNINGKDVPIEKIKFNPFHKIKCVDSKFIIIPNSFNEPESLTIGGDQYSREIKVHQIKNESADEFIFLSEEEEPLRLKIITNIKEGGYRLSITVALKYAKTVLDIVESIYIYNDFVDNKGKINGEHVHVSFGVKELKKFDEKYAFYWKKVLDVESVVNKKYGIKFLPPDGDLYEDDIALIEELYQSLVIHKPVRRAEKIKSVGGNSQIKDKINPDEIIGNKIMLTYPKSRNVEIMGANFRVFTLDVILDAIVSEYKIEGDRLIMYFADDDAEVQPFEATIDFLSEEDMVEFQKEQESGASIEQFFREAVNLTDLVDSVFE